MEEKTLKPGWVEIGIRWVIGGLFLFAGTLKLLDPGQFAIDIANYQIVPWTVAAVAAVYLPGLEILCGLGLICGWMRPGALRWLIFLMAVFLQALIAAWVRGLNIECGCFGKVFATSNYALLFLRDLAILGGLFYLLYREWVVRLRENPPPPAP